MTSPGRYCRLGSGGGGGEFATGGLDGGPGPALQVPGLEPQSGTKLKVSPITPVPVPLKRIPGFEIEPSVAPATVPTKLLQPAPGQNGGCIGSKFGTIHGFTHRG